MYENSKDSGESVAQFCLEPSLLAKKPYVLAHINLLSRKLVGKSKAHSLLLNTKLNVSHIPVHILSCLPKAMRLNTH